MREEGMQRLMDVNLNLLHSDYIVKYFLFTDIRNVVSKYASGRVLDIGCGNKPYKRLFESVAESYTGCDIVQSDKCAVDVICPATELKFPDLSFNTVFSTQVMEHVEEYEKMIAESRRVLTPGGTAIFTVPFCWELHEEPYDFFRFTKYGLNHLLLKHGFEPVLIKSNGGKWAACFQTLLNSIMSVRRYRTWRAFIVKHLFITLRLITVYNRMAVWLDKRYSDDLLSLNYIVVAKKK